MNILLTNRCNRRCTYCFAQERISYTDGTESRSPAPETISFEAFRTAIAYVKRSPKPVVGILGGEPSLHPQFIELLEYAWQEGVHTKVFSNGLWQESQIRAVQNRAAAGRNGMHVVVNMNGPARTPKPHQEAQEHLLARLGKSCSLSFNISRVDFDPFFLVDMITRYEIRPTIRLGIAQPLAEIDNEHVPLSEYHELVPTLVRLAELCDEHDIRLGFDCGFVLCMFTPEELGRLTYAGARFRASCGPALDVGTDLSTWSCFPLSTFCRGKRLTDFDDIEALGEHFRRELQPLFGAGALPDCAACRHRKRRQCSGGCGAHVYRSLNP